MAGYNDFIHLGYKPSSTDLLVSFRIRVPAWSTVKRAAGAVAAESSTGTWSKAKHAEDKHVQKVAGKVYSIKKSGKDYFIKVAYPEDHFEAGNMSQILASIAGNIFGMRAVTHIRLEDIRWPKKILKSFPGPQFGIKGVRKIFGVKKRPLTLSVPKPKVGMTTDQHCQIAKEIWEGGLDLLKDDENLANQKFNPFERRLTKAMRIRNQVEKKTGEKKSYLINITHSSFNEMVRRAKLVAKAGNEYVMIDIVTTGFTAVQSIRELCQDLGLAIHAHRAMHASFTRNPLHGFSMLSLAETSRLLGVDNLHIGTVGLGKLVGSEEEVLAIQEHITKDKVRANPKLHLLEENWQKMKPVFPVSSGGLHPGLLPGVIKKMGTDIFLQVGGGIHGHPGGSYAGAVATRAAVDGYMDGKTLAQTAKSCPELAVALTKWGKMKTR